MPPNTTAIPTPALAPSALQTYLNGIYKSANVEFTITSDTTKFDLSKDGTAGLERSDENMFGKYSLEMRALKSHYMAQHPNYDKKANYIFVIPSFTGGGLSGFMVRGRSVGFVVPDADMRTYAHELGHGVFGLEHTFPEIAETNIDNLMSYGTGTHLTHEQWKIMHARKPAYSWFDSEEDGSFFSATEKAQELFRNLRETHIYNVDMPKIDARRFYISKMVIGQSNFQGIEIVQRASSKAKILLLKKDFIENKYVITADTKVTITFQNEANRNALFDYLTVQNYDYNPTTAPEGVEIRNIINYGPLTISPKNYSRNQIYGFVEDIRVSLKRNSKFYDLDHATI